MLQERQKVVDPVQVRQLEEQEEHTLPSGTVPTV